MRKPHVTSLPLTKMPVWEKVKTKRVLLSFNLEITSRCNNDCRHCYINLPADDRMAKGRELTLEDVSRIAGEAVSLGALWCLITGGEPLLREDFFDIYLALKKKGLLLSVFTNANLIKDKHIEFFKKYPPRDIEVSVYGATQETYERVTRRKGSFAAFMRGINLLLESGIKIRFKAMALHSNYHEIPLIAKFCRERTKDYYRFDPFLHLRYDGNEQRNKEILLERLTPSQIVSLEGQDSERFKSLRKSCEDLIVPEFTEKSCHHLFFCGAGNQEFTMSPEGHFRLCGSLWHPDCIYDLKKGSLTEAWEKFLPQVREMNSDKEEFLEKCLVCPIINLCMWCPASAHLETGHLDSWVEYFCEVAHARAKVLEK